MENINQYKISINGNRNIPVEDIIEIDYGKDYDVVVRVSKTSEEVISNEDGSFTKLLKVKIVHLGEIKEVE